MRPLRIALCMAVVHCGSGGDPVLQDAGNEAAIAPGASPAQGKPCPVGGCPDGLTCVAYRAGGSQGQLLDSCEIRCTGIGPAKECPAAQQCVNISDGVGNVCRAL